MKLTGLLTVVGLLLLSAASNAFGGSLNLATGQNGSGGVWSSGDNPDAYWTVDPPGCTDPGCGAPVTAYTTFPDNVDWYGGWLANDSNSDWITRDADITNNGPAPYTFYFTFDLTDTTDASITGGAFAVDDAGSVILNGNTLASVGAGNWGGLTSFSTTTSDFVSGLNTLEIEITDSDQFLEAVRLVGTLNGDVASTPEPASWMLLMGGALALYFVRRKATA